MITKSKFAKTRVFLVDDHPIVRRGFQLLIGMEQDIEVCGEADNGPQALEKMLKDTPDVAVVDLSLKSSTGLDLIKQLRSVCPKVKILVYSMRDESIYAERALRAGASGYITKEEGAEKAIEGIRLLMAGKPCLSDRLTARFIERMSGYREHTKSAIDTLSDRELEVLQLIGEGVATRDLAKRLNVSIKTIESHRGHIKDKLGLKTGTELVTYAYKWAQEEGRKSE
jgi:DNA-binding NarL/FixJ family response regulator